MDNASVTETKLLGASKHIEGGQRVTSTKGHAVAVGWLGYERPFHMRGSLTIRDSPKSTNVEIETVQKALHLGNKVVRCSSSSVILNL